MTPKEIADEAKRYQNLESRVGTINEFGWATVMVEGYYVRTNGLAYTVNTVSGRSVTKHSKLRNRIAPAAYATYKTLGGIN
jgi:hypothetical protein